MSLDAELVFLREKVRDQQAVIERLRQARHAPIAIVGVGLRFPGDNTTLDGFAEFLAAGRSGTTPVPAGRWDVPAFAGEGTGRIHAAGGGFLPDFDQFDPLFFNISPREARCVDPQQRLVLETAWEALENANIDPSRLRHGLGGTYFGASSIDYAFEINRLAGTDKDGHLTAGIMHAAVSGRLSYFLGLRGPSITLDTACSSSLVALHLAVDGLRGGQCDIALAGGVNAIHHPDSMLLLSDLGALSGDGRCKTFDESADGYGRAEGCGVVVLRRLSDAERDGDTVLAVIRGSAVRQDGESAGLTVPNGVAQEALIRAALADAALTPDDIQYVEAHGTGTPLGDPIELAAINEVYGPTRQPARPLLVASLKTNFGHLEAAAGIGGLIKTVLQMRDGVVYPHLNMNVPSTRIPWDSYPIAVPTTARPWPDPVRRAMVNSFGVAGTIASVVLEQAPTPSPPPAVRPCAGAVLTLSAKTAPALRRLAQRYRDLLVERPDVDLTALCHTSNLGRAHFRQRVAGVVRDRAGIDALLDKAARHTSKRAARPAKVAFLFTGQGGQYAGMAAGLDREFPAFAAALDECDRLLAPHVGGSVRALLVGDATDGAPPDWVQPAMFAFQYALATLWMSWGVRPSAVIGHSLGEVVAAVVAGVLSLADAATLVAARSRAMSAVSGGMMSVAASADEVGPLLADRQDVVVAAINAPRKCVLSGNRAGLEEVAARLTEKDVDTRILPISYPSHSPLMAPALDGFRAALSGIRSHEPQLTVVSTRTGTVAGEELTSIEHWVRQLVEPVDFQGAVRVLHERGRHVCVEIGPGATLTSLARKCVPGKEHVWLYSQLPDDEDGTAIHAAAAGAYAAGLPVSWPEFHSGHYRSAVQLPSYPFEHKRYWLPIGDTPPPVEEAKPEIPPPGAPPAARVGAIGELIREKLAGTLNLASADDVDPDADFVDLGLDSMDLLALRQVLTETLRTPCPSVAGHSTVRRLAGVLERLGTEPAWVG